MCNSNEIEIDKKKTCSCGQDHCCSHEEEEGVKRFIGPAISFILLVAGMIIGHFHEDFFNTTLWVKPLWFFIAFIPVGIPVVIEAIEGVSKKDYFNELTLMSIACVGAFLIGEYAEAVGVMLFYSIGEILQDMAVDKATRNISRLLELKEENARVARGNDYLIMKPEDVSVGDIIEVRAGERVPLDGFLESSNGMFDTSALTGESIPRDIEKGNEVLAGMISSSSAVKIKVSKPYGESTLSRILDLVKNAQSKKAKSEVFIKKFARVYTPVVSLLALTVCLFPYFISLVHPSFHYVFTEWLYRALVFLVISCPCALVISVPLSYFAGIGAASRLGILFKGGNYLETIRKINVVAFDKTGTLTTGEFSVGDVKPVDITDKEFLTYLASAESQSNHPLAKALLKFTGENGIKIVKPSSLKEIAGKGIEAVINGDNVLAGNLNLLKDKGVVYPEELNNIGSTIIICALNGKFIGYVSLSDTLKEDSETTIEHLKKLGIKNVMMLSGDRKQTVSNLASKLGIPYAFGELLPQDKAEQIEKISKTPGQYIAFVGDGMNDAPVLALSNVGIAMGGLGSDAAIESADIVVQTDHPSRVAIAIKIGRYTHKIVIQNISGALTVKILVLVLGLAGIATLWGAVFADVGVALLAVLNSMRIMWRNY